MYKLSNTNQYWTILLPTHMQCPQPTVYKYRVICNKPNFLYRIGPRQPSNCWMRPFLSWLITAIFQREICLPSVLPHTELTFMWVLQKALVDRNGFKRVYENNRTNFLKYITFLFFKIDKKILTRHVLYTVDMLSDNNNTLIVPYGSNREKRSLFLTLPLRR